MIGSASELSTMVVPRMVCGRNVVTPNTPSPAKRSCSASPSSSTLANSRLARSARGCAPGSEGARAGAALTGSGTTSVGFGSVACMWRLLFRLADAAPYIGLLASFRPKHGCVPSQQRYAHRYEPGVRSISTRCTQSTIPCCRLWASWLVGLATARARRRHRSARARTPRE
jgi:hypothetical protein